MFGLKTQDSKTVCTHTLQTITDLTAGFFTLYHNFVSCRSRLAYPRYGRSLTARRWCCDGTLQLWWGVSSPESTSPKQKQT